MFIFKPNFFLNDEVPPGNGLELYRVPDADSQQKLATLLKTFYNNFAEEISDNNNPDQLLKIYKNGTKAINGLLHCPESE